MNKSPMKALCSNLRSGILVRIGKLFELMGLKELLEGHWCDMRVFRVIQILLQISLTVCAVVLVKPGESVITLHTMTHPSH